MTSVQVVSLIWKQEISILVAVALITIGKLTLASPEQIFLVVGQMQPGVYDDMRKHRMPVKHPVHESLRAKNQLIMRNCEVAWRHQNVSVGKGKPMRRG